VEAAVGRLAGWPALWLALGGLGAGGSLVLVGFDRAGRVLLALTVVGGLVPMAVSVAGALRRRTAGVDVIALLALAGSLALGEYLAGAVITVMLATGRLLERHAGTRARQELTALLQRAPKVVHRHEGGGLTSPPLAAVRAGDLLLVAPGEVVPVDGVLVGAAVLDESALTGEPNLAERGAGERVLSGVVNAGAAFDLRATTTAATSTYAGIVRLVQEAQASKAPLVRLADRYALWFLPVTMALAALAWALSGDPRRALAVLVVATPCPLILAAPVAIVAGISRLARLGVVVKSGTALETLARARVLLFDKTGTLTAGAPVVAAVEAGDGDQDRLLRLAASLEQVSPHVLAAAVVAAARRRGLRLSLPVDVVEEPGLGVAGTVDGHRISVGRAAWVTAGRPLPAWARRLRRRAELDGASVVQVGVDGELAGALALTDPIRPEAPRTAALLRRAGITRLVMVTGDRDDVAQTVGAVAGVDRVLAQRSPAEKVEAVRLERASGVAIMVGDGVNDAPALAAADVGVALGARGATASSEAADVVVVVDRVDRLADALRVASRSRRIALQSILLGMGLSLLAMGVAAGGLLVPVAGALVQEAVDVVAIGNALRALGDRRPHGALPPTSRDRVDGGQDAAVADRFRAEHVELHGVLERLRGIADRLDRLPPGEAAAEAGAARRLLADRVVPHERVEEALLYPAVARRIGGDDPTAPMRRAHVEIAHLARLFGRLLDGLDPTGPDPEDISELRRVLYGLQAVLRLHIAQEDEAYLSLFEPSAATAGAAPRDGDGPPA
jgi:heavy metal translocating P-type ATPase